MMSATYPSDWQKRHSRFSSAAGFSLIEMMISVAIGLVIIAGLVAVLLGSSGSSKSNDRTSELQSNGRYALSYLKRELRHAGYRGFTPKAPESAGWTTPTITNECGTAGNFVKNIRQAVWGANDSNPFSGNCLLTANALYNTTINSDVLVIRHADDTLTTSASAVANPTTLYINSSYSLLNLLQGSSAPAGTVSTGNFAWHVDVYYIGFDDAPNATLPALRRMTLNGAAMVDELVVSGIEEMQLEYGITNSDGTTQYFNADSIAGDHSATGATDWDKVSVVRLWLLARNSQAETGYTNTNSYRLSHLVYGPVNDSFRRQLFSTVVQLRNFRN
jgi:type IV pilus assembly protein PilW